MSDTPASKRGWGPGWPNCQPGTIATLTRPDGLRLPLRKEIIPLVAWLITETERRGYDVRPGQTWGYACRPIRGYQVASTHSWGLAIDINAPANPMLHGRPGWAAVHAAGRTDMPQWMPPLWNKYGFRWGGDYASRQDAMHYEFMGTPADAAHFTSLIAAPAPAPRPFRTFARDATDAAIYAKGGQPTQVSDLQRLLGVTADGIYGPKTVAAVVAFKTQAAWTTADGRKNDRTSTVDARLIDALLHLGGKH